MYKYIIWQVGDAAGCQRLGRTGQAFLRRASLSTGCLVLGGGRLNLETQRCQGQLGLLNLGNHRQLGVGAWC